MQLEGLSRDEFNGKIGFCGGYCVDVGRYTVYLKKDERDSSVIEKRRIGVKPENIRSLRNDDNHASKNLDQPLVDFLDRRNRLTALACVAEDGSREDLASFLLKHGADVDAGDLSARSIANSPFLSIFHGESKELPVCALIRKQISKLDRKTDEDAKFCAQCGKKEDGKITFSACPKCLSVCFCSNNCYRSHWPRHKDECSAMTITLSPQTQKEINDRLNAYNLVLNLYKETLSGGYHAPEGSAQEEKFVLKITACRGWFLLCYDKSHTCCFVINRNSKGFLELYNRIQPDWKKPTGMKAFSATFWVMMERIH